MIIKKTSINLNDIVSFRLVTGEEIVAKFIEVTSDEVVVSQPFQAQIQQAANGQLGIAFGDYFTTAKSTDRFSFKLSSLINPPSLSNDDITSGYKKATSPIIQPTGSLIK